MIHKIIALVFTAIGILLLLIGISYLLDYFYFSDFPSIIILLVGIAFMLFPIGICIKPNYLHLSLDKKRSNKENLKITFKIILGFVIFIAILMYDNKKQSNLINDFPKKTIEIKLTDAPQEIRRRAGKYTTRSLVGYKIYSIQYPNITFQMSPRTFNKNKNKLIQNKTINITILKDSYQNKIVAPNTTIPELFTFFSEKRVIQIIDIE